MEKKLDLAKYKKLLENEQERLLLERRALDAEIAEPTSDLSDYDTHQADAGSETFQRTREYTLDENDREILDRIADALRKIDEGSYGTCDRCGVTIHQDRLRAIPYATLCVNCQDTLERQ